MVWNQDPVVAKNCRKHIIKKKKRKRNKLASHIYENDERACVENVVVDEERKCNKKNVSV